jgi:hypothetical protein
MERKINTQNSKSRVHAKRTMLMLPFRIKIQK